MKTWKVSFCTYHIYYVSVIYVWMPFLNSRELPYTVSMCTYYILPYIINIDWKLRASYAF